MAPTNNAMVIRRHPGTGERRLDLLRWGLIPSWTKDLKAARAQPINARSETATTSGMFKAALAQRRCLVPADAFYEWETRPDGKQSYAIARQDGSPLAFAGVWEWWKAPDETLLRSFAILTTSANTTMRVLHERMPVILEPDAWPVWLGEDSGAAADLMRPAADDTLHLWPVSRAVNSVRNNGAELLDRVDDPNAPPPSDAPAGANPE
jgi:putative SOS response-associated peptidase YedK